MAFVVGKRFVGEAVEWYDRVDKIPHFDIGCMENVRSILVHIDACDVFAIEVATDVRPAVNDKTLFAILSGLIGEHSTI